ncbi:putative ATP synthase F1, delta subunit [Trichinella spiralis]|uniref:putative ATP synthase F1, delta subunit n=1 Tax=Trichinella spiralis TaxID=6334 RepID=UPI0001EFDFF6|nr:putative ATP synthase F1, delta subunit [Trichinella spiralis]
MKSGQQQLSDRLQKFDRSDFDQSENCLTEEIDAIGCTKLTIKPPLIYQSVHQREPIIRLLPQMKACSLSGDENQGMSSGDMFKEFQFRKATEKDVSEIKSFLSQDFIFNEPLSQALKSTADELMPLLTFLVESSVKDAFSILVKHKGTLVACVLNSLHTLSTNMGKIPASTFPEKATIIGNFINKMEENSLQRILNNDKQLSCGSTKYLVVEVISVSASIAGKGIAKKLLKDTEEMARQHNFNFILTIATNIRSQLLFEKIGYSTVYAIHHKDYLAENGRQIFHCLDNATICAKGMLKKI